MNDLKLIRDHSRKVPEAREHDFELMSASGNHQKQRQMINFPFDKKNCKNDPVNGFRNLPEFLKSVACVTTTIKINKYYVN